MNKDSNIHQTLQNEGNSTRRGLSCMRASKPLPFFLLLALVFSLIFRFFASVAACFFFILFGCFMPSGEGKIDGGPKSGFRKYGLGLCFWNFVLYPKYYIYGLFKHIDNHNPTQLFIFLWSFQVLLNFPL